MRNLRANTRKMWYATYTGRTNATDSNGDITGDLTPSYSKPVEFRANLSATRGTQGFTGTGSTADYFGSDIDYSLIISTANMELPIDEWSIIWTHKPVVNGQGYADYRTADYKVTSVARGLMHMKYAIKELNKTIPEPVIPANTTGSTTTSTTSSTTTSSTPSDDVIIVGD